MNDSLNILVCEDERLFAYELSARLRELGHNVIAVSTSGEQALETARKNIPDLALMDIRLEGKMLGTEAAEILYKDLDVPSVFLTAYADEENLIAAHRSHPWGYLVKPIRDSDLKTTISCGFARHKAHRQLKKELSELKNILLDSSDNSHTTSSQSAPRDLENKIKGLQKMLRPVGMQLNETLAAIYGHLEVMNVVDEIPPLIRKQVGKIQRECDNLNGLAKRIILSSSTEQREEAVRPLHEIIDHALGVFLPSVPPTINFNFSNLADTCLVSVSQEILVLAILELLQNALVAVKGEGFVGLSVNYRDVADATKKNPNAIPGRYVVISVLDSGVGFSTEQVELLFEPFCKTRKGPVLRGLGLLMAYAISRTYRGWLDLESLEPPEKSTASRIAYRTCANLFLPAVICN